jgi:hypothetical protein
MVAIQKLKVGLVAFLFLSLTGTPMVWADVGDPDSPWKRLTLKGGYFFANTDNTIRLDPTGGGSGTEIDLEDVLGLDENVDSFDVGVKWRFFDRHSISVGYFDLTRDASTAIGGTIIIGDAPPIVFGDVINTEFKWNTVSAFYTWSFLQTNKYEVGLNIGAHVTTFKFSVASTNLPMLKADSKSVTAPLPVLGLMGAYAFTPKLVLRADAGWFGIKVGEVEGSQWAVNLDLEYNMWKYMGFGIGYKFYTLDVDITEDDFKASINTTYNGFTLFLKFYL